MNKKGISFLEISLSIAIMLVIFAMTTPIYFKYIGKMKYATGVREIMTALKTARTVAMTSGKVLIMADYVNLKSACTIEPATETIYYPETNEVKTGYVWFISANDTIGTTTALTTGQWVGSGLLIIGPENISLAPNKLFFVTANAAMTITCAGVNFPAEGVRSWPADYLQLIPFTKKKFTSGIKIIDIQVGGVTFTTKTTIVFQKSGATCLGLTNTPTDYSIRLENQDGTIRETIKIVGVTGAIYKFPTP